MLTIEQLYDLNHTLAADYLRQFTYPWEALVGIKAEILRIGAALDPAEYTEVSEHVLVHKTATVAPTAYLGAPCIIGARTEVRHCAFIRGSALVGADCVVGNSVELKNVILFPQRVREGLTMIRLLVLDVDGTMTDGGVYYDATGNETKKFAIKDGAGLVLARTAGIRVMICTGRECEAVRRRAADLKITDVYQNVGKKAAFLRGFMAENHYAREEVAYLCNKGE